MTSTPTVTLIVVHHDQPERCRRTVDSLRAQELPAHVETRIVIVDNASSPGARASIASIAGVTVLDAGANLGYGGGANVGLRAWLATGTDEWAVIVAHDAEPAPDCLATMLAGVAEPLAARAGLVSAEYGDNAIPTIDPYFGALTVPGERGTGWRSAAFAHGTFLMLRRQCLEDVGIFDERYFAYCEEADLALRAKRRGWEAGIVWGAIVHNPHQGSPSRVVDYLMVRNTIALVRDHFGRYRATVRFLIALFGVPWHLLQRRRSSPWFDARARGLALRDVLLGRMGAPPPSLLGVP